MRHTIPHWLRVFFLGGFWVFRRGMDDVLERDYQMEHPAGAQAGGPGKHRWLGGRRLERGCGSYWGQSGGAGASGRGRHDPKKRRGQERHAGGRLIQLYWGELGFIQLY